MNPQREESIRGGTIAWESCVEREAVMAAAEIEIFFEERWRKE